LAHFNPEGGSWQVSSQDTPSAGWFINVCKFKKKHLVGGFNPSEKYARQLG